MLLIVPKTNHSLDPFLDLAGLGHDLGYLLQPIRQREHHAAVTNRLRDAAAVRADDGDSVDHGLDRHQRLVFPPE